MRIPDKINFDKKVEVGKINDTYVHNEGLVMTFLDTETNIDANYNEPSKWFKLGVVARVVYRKDGSILDKERWYCHNIEDIHEALNTIFNRDKGINIVAHNMSFDYQVADLQTWLDKTGYKVSMWYKQMTVTYIHASNGYYNIRFLDNMNWWPMSLDNVGKAVGEPKWEIDFKTCSYEALQDYCNQDVEVMIKAFQVYWQMCYENFGIRPRWTNGSTAIAAFGTLPEKNKITLHQNPEVIKASLAAYFGGRVEVFRQGEFKGETFHKVDINSLYPAVMARKPYPIRYLYSLGKTRVDLLGELMGENILLAKCTIETDIPAYPYRLNGRGIYPTGKFETWLTGEELQDAYSRYHITAVDKVYVFAMDGIFTNYVNRLIKLKEEYSKDGNWGKREVTKRLLNSLYGKFAQLGFKKENIGHIPGKPFWRGKDLRNGPDNITQIEVLNNIGWVYEKNVVLPTSVPIIAANVTANARAHMWGLFQLAGRQNCFYSDTDSIILNDEGLRNLQDELDDTLLGQLKYEGNVDHLTIYGPKAYVWGKERVVKGIPKRAVESEGNKYDFDSFRSLNKAIFNPETSKVFRGNMHRHLRFTLPEGYTVHKTRVSPPRLSQ